MHDDQNALRDINERIGKAENDGDRDWLTSILAPSFAFQRADPARTVDDRAAFLAKVKKGGDRRTQVLEPVELYGDRAVVECIVRTSDGDFHNLRLFVRREDGWKLLGWANERIDSSGTEGDGGKR